MKVRLGLLQIRSLNTRNIQIIDENKDLNQKV